MIHQLRALLGSIAHVLRQAGGSLLALVGLRALDRWVVPALVVLLAVGAVVSARDTLAILGARPEVSDATLSQVADHPDSGSVWYVFDALVGETSFATDADLGTHFYLARDPAGSDRGLIVRSPLDDATFRRRTVAATVVEDPDVVASALERFGALPPAYAVSPSRYLDETDAAGPTGEDVLEPSEIGGVEPGSTVSAAGRVVSPSAYAVADGDAWLYLFAEVDGYSAVVLRSPHAPDAQPMRLQGLFTLESVDLAPVLESDWFAAIDADVPTDRALRAGSAPPVLVEASWLPTILFGGTAILLLLSHLVGYPVFGRGSSPPPGRSLPLGGRIDVELSGRMPRDRTVLSLDGSPGDIERLSVEELALRMWRYGLLAPELSRRDAERQYVEAAGGVTDRLVVHERDQSAVVLVDRDGSAEVASGRLHRVGRSLPAVRLRQGRADVVLASRSESDRDRVAAELLAEASAGR